MTTIATVVKRLTVVGGMRRLQDEALLDSLPTSGPLRTTKGSLLVLVDAQGPKLAALGPRFREAVFQAYYRDPSLSITSSMVRAIRRARNQLLTLCSEAESRDLGISCLVFKGDDVYLAQNGPSMAFIVHDGQVQFIRGLELVSADPALDQEQEIEVQLFHSSVRCGDVIVLASDSLGQAVGLEVLCPTLYGQPADEVRDILYDTWTASQPDGDLYALIVEVADARNQRRPRGRQPASTSGRPSKGASNNGPGEMGASRPAALAREPAPDDRQYLDDSEALLGDRLVTAFTRAGHRLTSLRLRDLPLTSRQKRNLLAALTLLLVVCGSVLALTRTWQSQQLEATALGLIEDAESKEQLALTSSDPEVKRRLLLEADAMVQQAEELRPDDLNVRIVRERIQGNLDNLGTVTRVNSAAALVDLTGTGPSALRDLVVARDRIYVLDGQGKCLYCYKLSESGRAEGGPKPGVVCQGDHVGQKQVSTLVTAAFVPSGGLREKDALIVMDDNASLYQYDPSEGVVALRLIDFGLLDEVPLLDGYAGNLYLLEAASNRLLWFPPTATGYDRFAYSYLNPGVSADFADAVDVAVGSNLYVLHRSGGVDRFYGGKRQPFDGTTPDVPLKQPVALVIGQQTKSVYVLDTANQRVVEYDSDGRFRRQIKSGGQTDPFEKARDLAVDEARATLYLLSEQTVYAIDLKQ